MTAFNEAWYVLKNVRPEKVTRMPNWREDDWTPFLGHKPAIGEVTRESPEDKLVRIRQGIQQDKQARDIDDYNFDVERGEEDPTDLLMEELARQKAISMDRERQQKLREGVNMQQPTTPYRYPRGGHR